jgi:hypothetical protein
VLAKFSDPKNMVMQVITIQYSQPRTATGAVGVASRPAIAHLISAIEFVVAV